MTGRAEACTRHGTRNPTEAEPHDDRTKASGKTSMESMRCLESELSDIISGTWSTTPCVR